MTSGSKGARDQLRPGTENQCLELHLRGRQDRKARATNCDRTARWTERCAAQPQSQDRKARATNCDQAGVVDASELNDVDRQDRKARATNCDNPLNLSVVEESRSVRIERRARPIATTATPRLAVARSALSGSKGARDQLRQVQVHQETGEPEDREDRKARATNCDTSWSSLVRGRVSLSGSKGARDQLRPLIELSLGPRDASAGEDRKARATNCDSTENGATPPTTWCQDRKARATNCDKIAATPKKTHLLKSGSKAARDQLRRWNETCQAHDHNASGSKGARDQLRHGDGKVAGFEISLWSGSKGARDQLRRVHVLDRVAAPVGA